MYFLTYLISIIFISHYGFTLKLPTAPYNVKLFCRNGRAETIRSRNPSLCPTSSTSCGYFSFVLPEQKFNRNVTDVYECVDSSIFLSADEDYDDRQTNPYYQICNHRPQCREVNIADLNKQFLNYLVRAHGLRLEAFKTHWFKFCCSLSHSNLARLVKSNLPALPFSSSLLPVKCNKLQCARGAIGCLYHEKTTTMSPWNPPYSDIDIHTSQEYFDVKPVELTWNEDDLMIQGNDNEETFREMSAANTLEIDRALHLVEEFGFEDSDESDYNDGYKCVQMHLNDEVYRYCMMIYAQKTSNRCIEFDGHKICCCFVNPSESTCDPQKLYDTIPSTSTLPSITTSTVTIYPKIKVTATSSIYPPSRFTSTTTTTTTTTLAPPITVTQRTRCRTVVMTESRSYGNFKTKPRTRKRIVCDDMRGTSTFPETSVPSSIASFMSFTLVFRLFLIFWYFY